MKLRTHAAKTKVGTAAANAKANVGNDVANAKAKVGTAACCKRKKQKLVMMLQTQKQKLVMTVQTQKQIGQAQTHMRPALAPPGVGNTPNSAKSVKTSSTRFRDWCSAASSKRQRWQSPAGHVAGSAPGSAGAAGGAPGGGAATGARPDMTRAS
ncbi:MAG: hypothetical protein NXI08_16535 [bacterium]|nr:hypothetical protein [bacterium]